MTKKEIFFWILMTTIIIGTWIYSGYFISNKYCSMTERGQFGDMFGAVNSLFSGLAFLGLIFTIRLQYIELKLQREELKSQHDEIQLNRIEMKRAADAQERSEKAMLDQAKYMLDSAQMNRFNSLLLGYSVILDPKIGMKIQDDIDVKSIQKKIKALTQVLEQYDNLFKDYIKE